MLSEIFNNMYNLYDPVDKGSDNDLFEYIYDNYEKIIQIIDKTIDLDKKVQDKFIFFYKGYSDIEDFYSYFQVIGDDMINEYEHYLLFCISFRIIVLKIVNRNSDFSLKGKTEMNYSKDMDFPKKTIYQITTTNTRENILKFASYILVYYLEAYFSKKLYLALDFEFNNRQIALFQMNFESNPKSNDNSYIFMVLPTEFEEKLLNFLIKKILQNKYIKKLLHGSDSLDIPYIYGTLLNESEKDIVKFTSTLIDTRFMCEYIKIMRNEDTGCSIYNALLYFETIDENKFNFLEKTHDNMGPVEDISWNIHTLSEYQVLYGLYDVLFLKKFYYDILTKSNDDLRIFKYIIPELTRFVYLERRSVTNLLKNAKLEIDPINNYMVRKINRKTNYTKNITLISIYGTVLNDLVVDNPTIEITKLMKINYFRGQIGILCKKIIYHIITNKYKVYKNKNEIFDKKIGISDLENHMEMYNFTNLGKLIKHIKIKSKPLVHEKIKYNF